MLIFIFQFIFISFCKTEMKGCSMSSTNKEWLTLADLAAMHIPGLDVSLATLHRRASRQGWKKRKRDGIQGVAYEYHVSSLPAKAQTFLGYIENDTVDPESCKKQSITSPQAEGVAIHDKGAQALLTIWDGLEPEEKELLSKLLVRKGAELLVQLLDNETICLMQLTGEKREAALLLAQLVPERVREILSELRASRDMAGSGHQQDVDGQHKGVA
ncbi:DNA-binding protein [Serratia marcescens]|uniref:DNA-binding protein n=1 Tax=Serratia marcescens TaxID=615 RepID=UPI003D17EDF9